MNPTLRKDLAHIDTVLGETVREALHVLASLDSRPVAAVPPQPQHHAVLEEEGGGFRTALDEFNSRYAAAFSGSAGPRYLGFVTGGATPAALAGDWLTSTYDQNPTSGLDSSAPDLERETLGLLRDLFGLDDAYQGAFVTGATMSNFAGLAIAREWLGERRGVAVSQSGLTALGPVHILSGTPHSSVYKAASMLGIGRQSVRTVATLPDREAVDLAALEAALAALQGDACIVVANAGTVNSVDFDDLRAIAALREHYAFWLHVDAAFGCFAAVVPKYEALVAGIDLADSVCIDLHKWLNVPYDAAVQFSRRQDLQLRVFQNNAAYLGPPSGIPEFVHLTPENSRRLRAMPTWFALRAYGRSGVRAIVEQNVRLARALGECVAGSDRFRLLAPVRLNVVCFTLSVVSDGAAGEAPVQAVIRRLRDAGETFLTPTVYRGVWGIRAAFSNWRTDEQDVVKVWHALLGAVT